MMDAYPTLNLETLATETMAIFTIRQNAIDNQADNADIDCATEVCRCLYCHETYADCVCEL